MITSHRVDEYNVKGINQQKTKEKERAMAQWLMPLDSRVTWHR